MKLSIITPCFNEEDNVEELAAQVRAVMESLPRYDYEHIFIDNASQDATPTLLRALSARDPKIKVILNNRNFGHIKSPFHGLLQGSGEAVLMLACDLQDPPELIPEFIRQWEEGFQVVVGQKVTSEESGLFFAVRSFYYRLVRGLADVDVLEHVTGFGLYDREVIEAFRGLSDVYPYLRGLISELGFRTARVAYNQPRRKRGLTKNNFYTLFDMAMLGLTTHSKVPLRIATMLGFVMSLFSLASGVGYLFYKLLFWNSFSAGIAPIVIGVFFIASVQLFFLGIVGEYIGFIHTQSLKRPLVVERERIGFGAGSATRHGASRAGTLGENHIVLLKGETAGVALRGTPAEVTL